MKKLLALALIASVLGAASAYANNGAMDLSWNKCDVSSASTDKSYVCDGNAGVSYVMTGSFVQPFGVPDFAGVSAVVDIAFGTSVPDYWKFDSCNLNGMNAVNPTPAAPCGPQLFASSYAGGGFSVSYPTSSRERLRIDWATGAPTPPSTTSGTRYAGFALSLDPDAGVSTSCAGCSTPACIVCNTIEVFGFGATEDYLIDTPDARNFVTWQGGGGNCPGATPSQNKTWGSVKALYR